MNAQKQAHRFLPSERGIRARVLHPDDAKMNRSLVRAVGAAIPSENPKFKSLIGHGLMAEMTRVRLIFFTAEPGP